MIHRVSISVWGLFSLIGIFIMIWSGTLQAREELADYFSQGEAIYDADNLAKSRDDAIQNLLTHAIFQALSTFFEPSQIREQYADLQKKILNQPQRYVQKFQIFSETPSDGLYRIQGEVSVAMDVLQQDLERAGLAPSKTSQPDKFASSSPASGIPVDSEANREKEEPTKGGSIETAEEVKEETLKETSEVSSQTLEGTIDKTLERVLEESPQMPVTKTPSEVAEENSEKSSGGITPTRQNLLWIVAEKWEQEWQLPHNDGESQPLFAATVFQESEDHEWSLVFPDESESLGVDKEGNVSLEQAFSLAQELGIQFLAAGSANLEQGNDEELLLKVDLRVLDSHSRQSRGEIHLKELTKGDFYGEKLIELAAMVSVQLDHLLIQIPEKSSVAHESPVEPSSSPRPESVEPDRDTISENLSADNETSSATSIADTTVDQSGASHRKPGEWTLIIQSDAHYRMWEELERILKEKYPQMEVKSVEVSSKESRVHLAGVDIHLPETLENVQLHNGLKAQVKTTVPESRQIEIIFTPSQNLPSGSMSP